MSTGAILVIQMSRPLEAMAVRCSATKSPAYTSTIRAWLSTKKSTFMSRRAIAAASSISTRMWFPSVSPSGLTSFTTP